MLNQRNTSEGMKGTSVLPNFGKALFLALGMTYTADIQAQNSSIADNNSEAYVATDTTISNKKETVEVYQPNSIMDILKNYELTDKVTMKDIRTYKLTLTPQKNGNIKCVVRHADDFLYEVFRVEIVLDNGTYKIVHEKTNADESINAQTIAEHLQDTQSIEIYLRTMPFDISQDKNGCFKKL